MRGWHLEPGYRSGPGRDHRQGADIGEVKGPISCADWPDVHPIFIMALQPHLTMLWSSTTSASTDPGMTLFHCQQLRMDFALMTLFDYV